MLICLRLSPCYKCMAELLQRHGRQPKIRILWLFIKENAAFNLEELSEVVGWIS